MGAWIEMVEAITNIDIDYVAPHDGCVDWNYHPTPQHQQQLQSHPTMGAWIEIIYARSKELVETESHPTMGAWIEILNVRLKSLWIWSRTPRWVRGLK